MSELTDWLQAAGSIGQAIGTVAAVFYAINISKNQRAIALKDREQEDVRRARSLAVELRRPVEIWMLRLDEMERFLRSNVDPNHQTYDEIQAFHAFKAFEPPKAILKNTELFYLLGEANDDLVKVLTSSHDARLSIEELVGQFSRDSDPATAAPLMTDIWAEYRIIRDNLDLVSKFLLRLVEPSQD